MYALYLIRGCLILTSTAEPWRAVRRARERALRTRKIILSRGAASLAPSTVSYQGTASAVP